MLVTFLLVALALAIMLVISYRIHQLAGGKPIRAGKPISDSAREFIHGLVLGAGIGKFLVITLNSLGVRMYVVLSILPYDTQSKVVLTSLLICGVSVALGLLVGVAFDITGRLGILFACVFGVGLYLSCSLEIGHSIMIVPSAILYAHIQMLVLGMGGTIGCLLVAVHGVRR